MRTRKLGNTELELTRVGLGCWAMGGPWEFGWGPQYDDDSIRTIHTALDEGINWLDTAPIYGHGRSETIVGKALKQTGTKPIIATKCGLRWDNSSERIEILKPESIRTECEDSLKRLQVETIDMYQIHRNYPDEDIEQAWEQLTKLQQQGKVRYIGVCNFTVEQLRRIQKIANPVSLQPPYSMLHREVEDELLPFCAENNIGVIVYSPMQRGLLTGKITPQRVANLPEGDHRKDNPDFVEPNFSASLELVEKLRPIAQQNDITLAQLAIAWVNRRDEVTAAIVGARRPEQIKETAKAADIILSQQDQSEIEALIDERDRKVKSSD
ncbi:MAG: aldo/keto reductase [Sedimentisphaerales bacterium]|nr:aldo/keto reductase [Sedimentisphaerales bacterium]